MNPKWAEKRGKGGWAWSLREDTFLRKYAKKGGQWIADKLGRS